MKNVLNVLVLIVLALYVASPIDMAPGPIDDMILLLIYVIANRRKLVSAAPAGKEQFLERNER